MNKIATFFRTVVKSATDPQYGNDVVSAKASFSWKYFFLFTLLTALVTGARFMFPLGAFDVANVITQVGDAYPAELEVTGDSTGLHINQPLPYSVPIPEKYFDRQDSSDDNFPRNIVTFTSEAAIQGIDDIYAADSLVVLTETTAYIKRDIENDELRVEKLPPFEEPFKLDRSIVNNMVSEVNNQPFIKQRLYVPFIGVALLIALYPLMLISRLVTLAVYSLVMLLLVKLFTKGKNLGYGKIFQLSIHTMTPVVLLAYIFDSLNYTFFQGFIYFLAYAAWTLFVVSKIGAEPALAMTSPGVRRTPLKAVPKTTKSVKKAKKS